MSGPGAGAGAPEVRVLHVCTRFGTGGSERRVVDAVTATPGCRHTVVVGLESDVERLRARLPGVEVAVEPHLRRSPHPVADPLAYRALRRRIGAGADLVHTHQSKAGALGRLAASRAGVPVVHSLSMANFGPGFGRAGSAVYRGVERALAGRTAAYAVVGHDLAGRFAALGVPARKLAVVRSGIDLHRFRIAPSRADARRVLGLHPAAPLLAYVGRLERTKGSQDLPALLAGVRERTGLDVRLVVAGEGPEGPALTAEVARRGLAPFVSELGWTDQVPEVLAAADLLVLPSRCEGLPQVLVQAAAVGTPFVAYAADGTGELVARGADGEVVAIGAVEAAVAACARRLGPGGVPGPMTGRPAGAGPAPDRPDGPAVAAGPAAPVELIDGIDGIDLAEWEPGAVAAAYRALYASVLGQPVPEAVA